MRKVIYSLTVMAVALFAVPAVFAQTAAATGGGTNWGPIAAGFGMALAAVGAAWSQAKVGAAACEGMARNPGAAGAIRASMILGLVFIETLALLTLVIIFVKV
jgi:F-type H+-transporting ATPase subunit c